MKHSLSFFIVFVLLFIMTLTGCGNNVGVSGKVTFADGTPLTEGFVIFEQGTEQFHGKVGSSGNYSVGEGMKQGEYKIRILATSGGGADGAPLVHYVAVKYDNVNTSGLTCSVQGKTVYDITVEKP